MLQQFHYPWIKEFRKISNFEISNSISFQEFHRNFVDILENKNVKRESSSGTQYDSITKFLIPWYETMHIMIQVSQIMNYDINAITIQVLHITMV